MLKCSVGSGRIGKGCVLVNVSAPSVDVEGCILMNVTSKRPIVSKGGLLYNVVDAESARRGRRAAAAAASSVLRQCSRRRLCRWQRAGAGVRRRDRSSSHVDGNARGRTETLGASVRAVCVLEVFRL